MSPDEFKVGMINEVLTEYGPVNRFWFDGTKTVPTGTDVNELWSEVYKTIRTVSPDTLISSYRGDVCASIGTLYTNDGPPPNSTDTSKCAKPSEDGKFFHPTEMHGCVSAAACGAYYLPESPFKKDLTATRMLCPRIGFGTDSC